jgi:L-2-hydroxyglutarate oxidase LhgO
VRGVIEINTPARRARVGIEDRTGRGSPERIGIVGAGIVGLALAREIQRRRPHVEVIVLDKEHEVARHQTGRNSGVVHAGLYYPPGSLKARLCVQGARTLRSYCAQRDIPYEECGKLVVAVDRGEEAALRAIHERAIRNGVSGLELLGPAGIAELEPHVRGTLALRSPHSAITDFAAVAAALAEDVRRAGGVVVLGAEVRKVRQTAQRVSLWTTRGTVILNQLVTCAGLQADRVAELAGDTPGPRIVPFRGEYLRLRPERRHLVQGLVYPVPDPRYPFLGVHLTKRIDGEVLVGPNAVLALAREGYRWGDVRIADLLDTLRWPGFRPLARAHWRTALAELAGSLSRRRFVEQARRYVPELQVEDVLPASAGVRAQALDEDGTLVDDFRISQRGRVVNVRNAPSPAATSAFAIAAHLVDRLDGGA